MAFKAYTYTKKHLEAAREMFDRGCNNREVTKGLGISHTTFYAWIREIPEFAKMVQFGRESRIQILESSAIKRAIGYEKDEVLVVTDAKGQLRERRVTTKHYPGDPRMTEFLLLNLDPEHYRSRHEVSMPGMEDLFNKIINTRKELESAGKMPSDKLLLEDASFAPDVTDIAE